MTIIVQRVVLGLESYVPGAVFSELGYKGRLKGNIEYINNPYKFKQGGTVDKYYDYLPALIDKSLSLKMHDHVLWSKAKAFYKEVRNPIFHGHNLVLSNPKLIREVFLLLQEIYQWVDVWHDPNQWDQVGKCQ